MEAAVTTRSKSVGTKARPRQAGFLRQQLCDCCLQAATLVNAKSQSKKKFPQSGVCGNYQAGLRAINRALMLSLPPTAAECQDLSV